MELNCYLSYSGLCRFGEEWSIAIGNEADEELPLHINQLSKQYQYENYKWEKWNCVKFDEVTKEQLCIWGSWQNS